VVTFAQRLPSLAIRLLSVVAGGLILKHEVYDAESAEIVVIALGLWLIGVPPALWLDALRRTTRSLEADDGSLEPDQGTTRSDDSDGP
jgi:hypothetical protein